MRYNRSGKQLDHEERIQLARDVHFEAARLDAIDAMHDAASASKAAEDNPSDDTRTAAIRAAQIERKCVAETNKK